MSTRDSNFQIVDLEADVSKVISMYSGDNVSYPFHVLRLHPLDTDMVVTLQLSDKHKARRNKTITQLITQDNTEYSVHGTIVSVSKNTARVVYKSRGVGFQQGKAVVGSREVTIEAATSPYQINISKLPASCSFHLFVPKDAKVVSINGQEMTIPKSPCTLLHVENKMYVM